jgi:hypothetical protein
MVENQNHSKIINFDKINYKDNGCTERIKLDSVRVDESKRP